MKTGQCSECYDNEWDNHCKGCEAFLCSFHYVLHECNSHEKEAEYCQGCGKLIWLHSEKPVMSNDGDPFHEKCAEEFEAGQARAVSSDKESLGVGDVLEGRSPAPRILE